MNTIQGIKINNLGFNAEKLGDFIYYDIPLLSHFQNTSNPTEHYFYKWCDFDNECHRWLIFKVSTEDLIKFFDGIFTLLNLVATNREVTFLDLDDDLNKIAIMLCYFENIPMDYLPSESSFFKPSDYEPYATELMHKLKSKI